MVAELKQASTVDHVVRTHNDFLDACLKECLLTNHELVTVDHTFCHCSYCRKYNVNASLT